MVTIGRTTGFEWADEYCKYLNMLGISARKITENDPDWIDHSIPGAWYRARIGALKIDGRNIHQLDFLRVDGKGSTYFHHLFVVSTEVGEKAKNLKADWMTANSLSFKRGPHEFVWKGGALAESLNLDPVLNNVLTPYQRGIDIDADKNGRAVTILLTRETHPDYLPQNHFEAIDKIAEHILKLFSLVP